MSILERGLTTAPIARKEPSIIRQIALSTLNTPTPKSTKTSPRSGKGFTCQTISQTENRERKIRDC